MSRKNLRHHLFLVLSIGPCTQFAAAPDFPLETQHLPYSGPQV